MTIFPLQAPPVPGLGVPSPPPQRFAEEGQAPSAVWHSLWARPLASDPAARSLPGEEARQADGGRGHFSRKESPESQGNTHPGLLLSFLVWTPPLLRGSGPFSSSCCRQVCTPRTPPSGVLGGSPFFSAQSGAAARMPMGPHRCQKERRGPAGDIGEPGVAGTGRRAAPWWLEGTQHCQCFSRFKRNKSKRYV